MIRISPQPFPYRLLSWVFLLYLITSCATSREIAESEHARLIEYVPFYAQESFHCGPSSLAGVLKYWGVDVTPDDIAKEIFSESARGTLSIDMVLYAQRKGLNGAQYRGSMDDLKKNLDSGYPLIVLVDYGFYLYQVNHFMVVVGYNDHGVIVNSGREREKFIAEKDFMKAWEKTKYWTLLIKQ